MLSLSGKTSLRSESGFALRFMLASLAVYSTAGGIAWGLFRFGGRIFPTDGRVMPPAFVVTTGLLAVGSGALYRALLHVRRERQQPFRRCLLIALAAGTLFVGLQSFGLGALLARQNPADVATDVTGFIIVFVALHALHFGLALWFLIFVTLRAFADAYDHEYSWGVTLCGWFWHALGIAWGCILAVFVITA